MDSRQDVPLSIAILAALAIGAAWFYLNYLRFSPELLEVVAKSAGDHKAFWWISVSTAALNLAIIGSFVKRTIGLQKQGSKLKQLEGEGFDFKISKWDLLAVVTGVSTFFYFQFLTVPGILSALAPVLSTLWQSLISKVLAINFAVLAAVSLFIVERRVRKIKWKTSKSLELPPFCLVLGTTPVKEK